MLWNPFRVPFFILYIYIRIIFSTHIITERTTELKNHWRTQGNGSPERLHQNAFLSPNPVYISKKEITAMNFHYLSLHITRSHNGEGNGTPLQYSCLENPMDGEPGRLQSMGPWRVGHDWATSLSLFTSMHWRRKWQPTPVFLPGESQGRGSLVGCCLWGHTESDTTEVT